MAHRTLCCVNFRLKIAAVGQLHDYAQRARALLEKGLFVATDVFVLDGGEYAHFIDRIVFFLRRQFGQSNLLESVMLPVVLSDDLVNFGEGSRS